MTAKEFLMQAWKIDKRIDRKIEERERLTARLMAGRMSNLSGMPRGGRSDWTDAVDAVAAMDAKINAEIMELCRIKRDVNEAIDSVEDMRYRAVLELRYRNYKSWEQIAVDLGYNQRNVFFLHGKALLKIHVPQAYK